jgi:hypothetical protein
MLIRLIEEKEKDLEVDEYIQCDETHSKGTDNISIV